MLAEIVALGLASRYPPFTFLPLALTRAEPCSAKLNVRFVLRLSPFAVFPV